MLRLRFIKDYLFKFYVVITSLLIFIPLIHLTLTVIIRGSEALIGSGINFFTDLPPTPTSLNAGGIAPSLIGSFTLTLIALPTTIFIALFAAILTNEFPDNFISKCTDVVLRSFTSIPTIVVSMAVYLLMVVPMRTYSALAAALALTIISLPYAYTTILTALRQVPQIYKEAAYSIGMTRWLSIVRVILPIARKMLATGVIITMARLMGETAALMFTAGRLRSGITVSVTQPVDAIPLLIFDYALSPFPVLHKVAWGATLVLLIMYLLIFLTAKLLVREVKL